VAPALHHRQTEITQIRRRLTWLAALLFLGIVGVVARLWFLQVLEGERYANLANRNIYRVIRLPALRGTIRDRNGVLLAGNRPAYNLVAVTEDLADRRHLPETLYRLFPEEAAAFDAALANARAKRIPSFMPVLLKEDLAWQEMAAVEQHAAEMAGITIAAVPVRHYPEGELAAHLLGYVGKINEQQLASPDYAGYAGNDEVGQSGVERTYQSVMRGQDGHQLIQVDSLGRVQQVLSVSTPVAGPDLYLTLDSRFQREAERLLAGRRGAVVALDPRNGAVLALASFPTFDPNRFASGLGAADWQALQSDPSMPLMNRASQGQYPPGSVFKIVVAVGAMEDDLGGVGVFCNGALAYHGRRYRCWKKTGHGQIDLHRAVVESCDVFFYELGLRLGIGRIAHYARCLGLGRPTGIDLPGESAALIPDAAWKRKHRHEPWWGGETLSTAIGQGFVLTTPLQLARMIAAIGAEGVVRRPFVGAAAGSGAALRPLAGRQDVGVLPLSVAHLEGLRNALEGAVEGQHGTGGQARVKAVRVAGKTGTAQVVGMEEVPREVPEAGKHHRDHALFVCFAPVEAPTIAIAVVVEHGGHGGESAAPIAGALLDWYFRHPEMAEVYPQDAGKLPLPAPSPPPAAAAPTP